MGRTDWDDEPVEWCSRCGSLAVKEAGGVAYCAKCGCTRVRVGDIDEWRAEWGDLRAGGTEGKEKGKRYGDDKGTGEGSGFGFRGGWR